MVTKKNTTQPAHNIEGLPASWADTEVLDGISLVEKDELLGKLFRVRRVQQFLSTAGYPGVRVEVEFVDGKVLMFQDFSATQGVRAEIEEILTKQSKQGLLDEWIPLKFICPEGLRISKYEKEDSRGVMRPSRSYYLTRSGVTAD